MKHLFLSMLFLLAGAFSASAQNDAITRFFNQYADERGSRDFFGKDGRWATAWAQVSCVEVRYVRYLHTDQQKIITMSVLS